MLSSELAMYLLIYMNKPLIIIIATYLVFRVGSLRLMEPLIIILAAYLTFRAWLSSL